MSNANTSSDEAERASVWKCVTYFEIPAENLQPIETPTSQARASIMLSPERAMDTGRTFRKVTDVEPEHEEYEMVYGEKPRTCRICVFVDSRDEDYNDTDVAKYIAKRVANIQTKVKAPEKEEGEQYNMVSVLKDGTTNQAWLTTARRSVGRYVDGEDSMDCTTFCSLHAPFHQNKSRDQIPCFYANLHDAVQTDGSKGIDISEVVVDNGIQIVRTKVEDGRNPLTWRFGYDVLKVRIEEEHFSRNSSSLKPGSFEIVDSEFPYQVGIKIVIPAWGIQTVDNNGVKRDRELFEGDMKDINFHTGQITGVGTYNIEYNVNTYKGVSGAPVICVDRRPGFERYRCKVIAIHAGAPQGTDMHTGLEFDFNIGFKTRCGHENSFVPGNIVELATEEAVNGNANEGFEEEADVELEAQN